MNTNNTLLRRVTARITMRTKSLLIIFFVLILALAGWLLLRPKAQAVTVTDGAQAGDLFLEPCTVKVDGAQYQADCGTDILLGTVSCRANLLPGGRARKQQHECHVKALAMGKP